MDADEPQTDREDVVAELDALIQHTTTVLKSRRSNVRRRLMDWKSALEDAKKSVTDGTTTEEQVEALVDRGCRLAGAFPAEQVGDRGLRTVWMITGEAMANDVAIVQRLGDLLRTQIDGADASP
jgi:hypothetical protein